EAIGRPARPQRLAVAEQWIAFVGAGKFRVGDPRPLHELELPRDVGIETDEAQASLLVAVLAQNGILRREPRSIFATAPQDAMKPGGGQQIGVRALAVEAERAQKFCDRTARARRKIGIAGVGATDVGAERAGGCVRIIIEGELGCATDPPCGASRRPDRRRPRWLRFATGWSGCPTLAH